MKSNFLVIAIVSFLVLISLALLLSFLIAPINFEAGDFSFATSILVVPIKGEITSSSDVFFGPEYCARDLVKMIEQANEDPDVGAILLDIDSGGGSAVASKQVAHKVYESEKPVVAYIGEVGASGAYYIAAAADYVVADESSITGSIGVLTVIPNFEELMEKIGVKMLIIKEGEFKSMGDPYSELTEEEKEMFQTLLHEVFLTFKLDVLKFREGKLSAAQFERIADGRILSGKQALQYNLIDETSTFDAAVEKAVELAGMRGEPYLKTYTDTGVSILDIFLSAGYYLGIGFKQGLVDATLNYKPNIRA